MQFPNLAKFDRFAYDTETTGLYPMAGDRVFGFSVSTPDGNDYYYDIRRTPEAVHWINDQFKMKIKVICHNLSFDYRMSKASGIHMNLANCYDTAMLACLINEHEVSYSLDNLARRYTNHRKSGESLYAKLAAIFGGRATKNVQMPRLHQAPVEVVAPYAKDDTRATLELFDWQWAEINNQNLWQILEFERELTPIIIDTEMHGVKVDIPAAYEAVAELDVQVKAKQKELNDMVGFDCNAQPSKDIPKVFKPQWRENRWWAIDGTPLEMTEGGNASINADALRLMSHPASDLILDLRSLIKTRDTFLIGHVIESSYNGRVYPGINQNKGESGGTGTGRLSVVEPALQQIPDRNKVVAERVKKIFLPDEGHIWVDGDMASFEVRIFAHLVGTPDIMQAYQNDSEIDFHQYVADLTGLPRNATYSGQPNAKQLNLSMIFNSGNGAIADKMGMPWHWESFVPRGQSKEIVYKKAGFEAEAVIDKYHHRLPGVKKLADGCKKVAENRGYLFTRYGRHLRFPGKFKTYKASGILIQSTAADENKMNWKLINEGLRAAGGSGRMLLNTHDSYSMSMPMDDAERTCKMIKERVEFDRGLRVPLILEINGPGQNWWESKSAKRWM